MTERKWPALTPEQEDAMIKNFKIWTEEGKCQRKLRPPLLGLDWDEFVFAKCPGHEGEIAFESPPEFVSIGLATLDAYATAVLAGDLPFETLGVLRFQCDLGRFNPGPDAVSLDLCTVLVFRMDSERGGVDFDSVMPSVIDAFGYLLSSLDIGVYEGLVHPRRFQLSPRPGGGRPPADPRLVEYRSDEWGEFKLLLHYPGQMVPEKSPYLRDRPAHLWPSVSLTLTPTEALRSRAREVVAFLRGSPNTEEAPN
jgi:hypothetical protein